MKKTQKPVDLAGASKKLGETVNKLKGVLDVGAAAIELGLGRTQQALQAAATATDPRTHVDVAARLLVQFCKKHKIEPAFLSEAINRAWGK